MTKPAGRLWTKCWSISWPRTDVFGDGDSRNGVHQSSAKSCRVKPAAESRFKTVSLEIRRWLEITSLARSEEHTSELQSLMRISYAVFCLKKKKHNVTEID